MKHKKLDREQTRRRVVDALAAALQDQDGYVTSGESPRFVDVNSSDILDLEPIADAVLDAVAGRRFQPGAGRRLSAG